MSRGLGLAAAAGLASAVVFLSALTGGSLGVVLLYVVPLPLALVGLTLGFAHAAVASALAVAVLATTAPAALSVYVAAAPLPVLILVREALAPARPRPQEPPGAALAWLAVFGAGLMLGAAALLARRGTGLEAMSGRYVEEFVGAALPMAGDEVKSAAIRLWTALFPAVLGIVWLTVAVLNGMLAQWTATKAGHALRQPPAYAELALPRWLPALLLVAAAAGAFAGGQAGYLGRNAAVLLLGPYMFAGLAAVHRELGRRPAGGLWLALFYVLFLAVSGWALLPLAGLGLISDWTRLRRRNAARNQEEK